MRNNIFLIVLLLMTGITEIRAQSPVGLWEIAGVEVAEREMTPVAKWTRINADGTYRSGNGWQQNSVGSWTFDQESGELFTVEKNGLKDQYGPFKVIFSAKDKMIWKRDEEELMVTVKLKRTDEIPRSTADMLSGLWDLESIRKGGQDIREEFDPENRFYLYIRWDRIYQKQNATGKKEMGYWHIDAHRPEITLINQADHTIPIRHAGMWL